MYPPTPDSYRTIQLNEYQVANLLALIEAIGYPNGGPGVTGSPLGRLHSGDWLGEIYWKLATPQHPTFRPNFTPIQLVHLVFPDWDPT